MNMPRLTALGGMSPGERQRMLAEARRRRDEQRDDVLTDGLQRSLMQAMANNLAQLRAEVSMVEQCVNTGLIPVRLGDIRRINIFAIITGLEQGIAWAERHGLPVTLAQRETVNGFMHRKYEETLDLILQNFLDLDGSVAQHRLAKYGHPVAPNRFDDENAQFHG